MPPYEKTKGEHEWLVTHNDLLLVLDMKTKVIPKQETYQETKQIQTRNGIAHTADEEIEIKIICSKILSK